MSNTINFLHRFDLPYEQHEKPGNFTFPFFYDPHPLSLQAAAQLQRYLENQQDFQHNFGLDQEQEGSAIGKMFGVLVVEDQQAELGFLAACSGKLANSNQHQYFVPPIFDMLDPEGFFLQEEGHINAINHRIDELQAVSRIPGLKDSLELLKDKQNQELAELRKIHKSNKAERKQIRIKKKLELEANAYAEIEADLVKQSYRDQHEYDLAKQACLSALHVLEKDIQQEQELIDALKLERKSRSAALQQRLFDQYQFLNAHLEERSVLDIFQESLQMLPPAGAGECAAPKLLQYAYKNNLKPVCMAEFWWGDSPNTEVRKHQYFYPACRGKCEPILSHMLQGLVVDPNPMLENPAIGKELEIIYEDDDLLLVNKPAEFLSVPGIHIQDSVQTRILKLYPEITGPVIIHRLDMSTSGLLVLAKHKEAHQRIQDQFIRHTVQKRYTALLDGVLDQKSGLIDLPLRVDLDDRPRQVVCYEYGKPAQTRFEVQAIEGGKTRIHFYPITGRTHQLRVHAAHSQGLSLPIVGDDLYGVKADRLHLHAGYLAFIHPSSQKEMKFELPDPF